MLLTCSIMNSIYGKEVWPVSSVNPSMSLWCPLFNLPSPVSQAGTDHWHRQEVSQLAKLGENLTELVFYLKLHGPLLYANSAIIANKYVKKSQKEYVYCIFWYWNFLWDFFLFISFPFYLFASYLVNSLAHLRSSQAT